MIKVNQTKIIEKLTNSKLIEINQACTKAITSGFKSSFLGVEHIYQSEEKDQLNLMGAKVRGTEAPVKCSADGGETWEYKIHTPEQVLKVYNDGASHVEANLIKADTLKKQISNAATVEELEQIKY